MTVTEPWGWDSEKIAKQTDWQLEHLYLRPAKERAEALERERRGLPPKVDESSVPSDGSFVPPRAMMVGVLVSLGMTNEQANAEYDRQVKMEVERKQTKG